MEHGLFYVVSTMAVDVLAKQVTRASAAMVLNKISQNILTSAPQGLTECLLYS